MIEISRSIRYPITEPVSLREMKQYLRVMHDNEDQAILDMIAQACEMLGAATSKSIVSTDIVLRSDRYFRSFRLPYGPVREITTATLDGEDVIGGFTDQGVLMKAGTDLAVEYLAGPVNLPGVGIAIKETVAYYFNNRGTDAPMPVGVRNFIQQNNEGFFI
jgi:hypothetical protein